MAHGYGYGYGYGYHNHKDFTFMNLSIAGSSGAIIFNPKEVADWIVALFNVTILPKKQLQEMQTLASTKTGLAVKPINTGAVAASSLGLLEQYSKELGPIWTYEGVTFGYTAVYMYAPKYNLIVSLTTNIGSLKSNPIQFSRFAMKVLKSIIAN